MNRILQFRKFYDILNKKEKGDVNMNCPVCQHPVGSNEKFCQNCGAALSARSNKPDYSHQYTANQSEPVNYSTQNAGYNANNGYVNNSGYPAQQPINDPNSQWNPNFGGDPYAGQRPPKKVSFSQAVKNFFSKYADFSGRAVMSEYWWIFVFNMIVGVVLNALQQAFLAMYGITVSLQEDPQLYMSSPAVMIISLISFIYSLATIVPGFALTFRRLHDTGKSGKYMLYVLIPLVGPIILLVFICGASAGDNQWGPAPQD